MSRWYYAEDGKAKGPVESDQLVQWILEGKLSLFDLVFQQGDTEWKPVAEYEELKSKISSAKSGGSESERRPLTKADLPKDVQKEWVVLKKKAGRAGNSALDFEQLGPFSHAEVEEALYAGKIQFSDFIWRPSYTNWMRIGNVRDFDRRLEEDSAPDVPTPKKSEQGDLVLSTEEEWELTRRIVTVDRGSSEDKDKPAEAAGPDLVSDPFRLELDFENSPASAKSTDTVKESEFRDSTRVLEAPEKRAEGASKELELQLDSVPSANKIPSEPKRRAAAEITGHQHKEPHKTELKHSVSEGTASRNAGRDDEYTGTAAHRRSQSRGLEAFIIVFVVLVFAMIGGGATLFFLNRSGHLPAFLKGENGGVVQSVIQWMDQRAKSLQDESASEGEEGDESTNDPEGRGPQSQRKQSRTQRQIVRNSPKRTKPVRSARAPAAVQVKEEVFPVSQEPTPLPERHVASRAATYLKARVMSSQAEKLAKLILQTDGAGRKVEIRVHGAPGKVVGVPGIYRVYQVPVSGGRNPVEWYFAKNGLPPGEYQMEISLDEHTRRIRTGYINRGGEFRKNLREHLKQVSLTFQRERKALFYSALRLEGLAQEFVGYQRLPGKENWEKFYQEWKSRNSGVLPPGLSQFQAYGREATQLKELHQQLRTAVDTAREEIRTGSPEKSAANPAIEKEIRALKHSLARHSIF